MLHADYPPFPGFTPEGLQFLRDLRAHNDREWFVPRKPIYEDHLLDPARCLLADFARRAGEHRLPLTADPKRGTFRIYRDTRFSRNKEPYKTHVGMVMTRSGEKNEEGAVYVHVEPGAAFIAGGYWHPDPKLLRGLRTRIAEDPEGWLGLVARVEAAGLSLSADEPLTRMPRGFEALADSPVADWLRGRSLVASRPVADDELLDPAFTDTVLDAAAGMLPLLAFGWEVG